MPYLNDVIFVMCHVTTRITIHESLANAKRPCDCSVLCLCL